MNRPDINEFPATDSRTYKLLSKVIYEDYDWKRFAIDQDKCIDHVLEEKKALTKALEAIQKVTSDEDLPLFKVIHQIAFKTLRL